MLVKFGFYSFDKLLNLTDTLLGLVEKNMIDVVTPKEEDSIKENIEQKVILYTVNIGCNDTRFGRAERSLNPK